MPLKFMDFKSVIKSTIRRIVIMQYGPKNIGDREIILPPVGMVLSTGYGPMKGG